MLSEEALAAEGIAVLRRSGSTEKQRPPVAAQGGGAGTIEDQMGRKARCRAPGSRRGGCRPRGVNGADSSAPSQYSVFENRYSIGKQNIATLACIDIFLQP